MIPYTAQYIHVYTLYIYNYNILLHVRHCTLSLSHSLQPTAMGVTGVTCTGLNPDGLITASTGNRRRKRMRYIYESVEYRGFVFLSDCLGCVVLLCLVVCLTLLASFYIHVLMRDEKEERKKQARSNEQTSKAKQHSTPKAVTFPKKSELPWVGLEPTTLYVYIIYTAISIMDSEMVAFSKRLVHHNSCCTSWS